MEEDVRNREGRCPVSLEINICIQRESLSARDTLAISIHKQRNNDPHQYARESQSAQSYVKIIPLFFIFY